MKNIDYSCPLCDTDDRDSWLYEDKKCYVRRNENKQWIIVLKEHTMAPTYEDLCHLKMVVKKVFEKDIKMKYKQEKVKGHLHWRILRWNSTNKLMKPLSASSQCINKNPIV